MLVVYRASAGGRGFAYLNPSEAKALLEAGTIDPTPCEDRACDLDHAGPAHHPTGGVPWAGPSKARPGGPDGPLEIEVPSRPV